MYILFNIQYQQHLLLIVSNINNISNTNNIL